MTISDKLKKLKERITNDTRIIIPPKISDTNEPHFSNKHHKRIRVREKGEINQSVDNLLKNNEAYGSALQTVQLNQQVGYREPDFRNFKYWCEICNERFCFPNLFQDHINLHARLKPYKCELCNKQFATMLHLGQHKEDHGDGNNIVEKQKYWQCEICGKYFKAPSFLKRHFTSHNKKTCKKDLCEICGTEFLHLKRHIEKYHNKSNSYKCHQCGKKFNTASYLRVHTDKHNDKKRYCCDLCGKVFTFASGLKSHKKSHIFESCKICKKTFNSKLEFKKHVKINMCTNDLTSNTN